MDRRAWWATYSPWGCKEWLTLSLLHTDTQGQCSYRDMGTDILKPSRRGCWKKFENQIKSSAWACPQRIQKGIWAFPE